MKITMSKELAEALDIPVIRRYSQIRYTKKLNQQIDNTLRKYNNKIKRLARQHSNYILPQQMTRNDLMNLSYTREDIQRRLKDLEKFTRKGAEKTVYTKSGYAISRYEMRYLQKEKMRVISNLQKSIEFYETRKPKLFGKEQSTTFARMGDTRYQNIKDKLEKINVDISNLPIDELMEYRSLLFSLGKDKNYLATEFKINYMEMITDLGYYADYPSKKLDKIKSKLMKINPEDFYDLYINEQSIKDVTNYYYTKFKALKDVESQKITDLYDDILSNIDTILEDYT